jgi:GntR family transcriptional regulator
MRRADAPSRRVPAYVEVLRALRQDLRDRAPGSAMPSEREIAARFGVARTTVRTAVRVLTQDGVLVVRRGAGAFVARPRVEVPGHVAHADVGPGAAHDGLRARVLRFDRIGAEAAAADALGLTVGAPVFRIERILLDGSAVVAHERSCVAVETCPTLVRYNPEQVSLADLLAGEGVIVVSAMEEVCAAAAGRTFASLVRGRPSDPVLIVRRTTFASRGRAIEWSVATYRADRYRATYRVALEPSGSS